MPHYDVIIGLEIHTELKTNTKMFCSCANNNNARANFNTCPICLGHPGTLPNLNEKAVELGCLLALALNCKINQQSKFDRKNYFYPDLPKGYQISQYDQPLAWGGFLNISPNHDILLTRLHLEEDTGKLVHTTLGAKMDYNRAGVPLLELVTEPLIKSAEEAKLFAQKLQQLLRYLNISDADMEKGLMRCEANVSLKTPGRWHYNNGLIEPTGDEPLNHKVEVKNINSFKALESAINFEITRQTKALEAGQNIKAQTRGWDEKIKGTKAQRRKETSADYRYFPEPDLPPLDLDDSFISRAKQLVIELPADKHRRFAIEYGLPANDIELLINQTTIADYFENVVSELRAWIIAEGDTWERQNALLSKTASNWLNTELNKLLNSANLSIQACPITPENFAELVKLIYKKQINSSAGQTIMAEIFKTGGEPKSVMRQLGLEQLDDTLTIKTLVEQVLKENPSQAEEFKTGKIALSKFFVGKVMALSGGKANPVLVEKIINLCSTTLKQNTSE